MAALPMNDKLEGIWKEVGVASFKVPPRHLAGGTEKIHDLQRKKQKC